jgi:predicted metal-dependent phosphoesterase TrpH
MQVDLHVHSHYSYDSFQSPREILETASRRGLDAVAVTDHDSFESIPECRRLAKQFGVIYVPGCEIRTDEYDDLLVLFVDEPIQTTAFEEVIAEVERQDGLAVLPHPYRKFERVPDWALERVDAIEGFNARSTAEWNEQARRLGERHDFTMLGGSDAHMSWEIGRGRSAVQDDRISTREELRDAIARGAVSPEGSESPYYLSHGASVIMEKIKARTGYKDA